MQKFHLTRYYKIMTQTKFSSMHRQQELNRSSSKHLASHGRKLWEWFQIFFCFLRLRNRKELSYSCFTFEILLEWWRMIKIQQGNLQLSLQCRRSTELIIKYIRSFSACLRAKWDSISNQSYMKLSSFTFSRFLVPSQIVPPLSNKHVIKIRHSCQYLFIEQSLQLLHFIQMILSLVW